MGVFDAPQVEGTTSGVPGSPGKAPVRGKKGLLGPQPGAFGGKARWAESIRQLCRCMHEVDGFNLAQIAKKTEVPLRTVKAWKIRYGWLTKGQDRPEVQALTRQLFIEECAKQGMPPEEAIKLLVKGMTMPADEVLDPDTGKVLASRPDYRTQHKYQKDYWSMAGMLGGQGRGMEVHAGEGGTVNIQVNLPGKEMEEEE